MARPIKTRKTLTRVEDTEDSSTDAGMEDIEAGLSEITSTSDLSVFTVNPVSECSYEYIE